ncbi:protein aluminum SENSITIVE 3-related protein [Skeletonema marinoi]|uniref:Protein aluminum SENSITIVE 3-related protein n=1 Tax=Skeletonema marinoi TaxID=267567 RepID=A0AAD8Y5L4_9STRA|nr:protein aluminum SENSITIVE 3-related protein [Skeletonema marinoi]
MDIESSSSGGGGGGGGGSGSEVVHVTTAHLIATALPLVLIAAVGYRFDLGIENGLTVGIVRSFLQLMILGMILQPIFVLGMDMSWVVGLYVFAMIIIATHESLSRQKYHYKYNSLVTFLTIFTSITAVGSFAFLFVVRPEPYWNPQYVIPICGMLLKEGGEREIELCLSLGATGWESVERLAKEAISTGTTPMINSLHVIGLISIPGMMTGQILGGSPVTEAAHYQILIIYLISTCTFLTIFMNIYAMYRVAFDTGTHIFRVDRFIKVEKKKLTQHQRFKLAWVSVKIYAKKALGWSLGAAFSKVILCLKVGMCCFKVCWKRHQHSDEEVSDLERQPLSDDSGIAGLKYDSSSAENKVQILSNKDAEAPESSVVFRISNLQFSKKQSSSELSSSDHPSSMQPLPVIGDNQPEALLSNTHENRRILCANLCATLTKGEIGIVRGKSGAGKSTLMRVLSGLTEADSGDVFVSNLTGNLFLSDCKIGSSRKDMVRWRSEVRYVTQYKVDIPGTPRDFIDRIKKFRSSSTHASTDLVSSSIAYLEDWGMESTSNPASFKSENEHNPFLDKEWKSLSGGESQRMLLAIALSTKPRILLLDESTSGLDARTEQRVEKSLIDYANGSGAAILWITHSEDIATRLLK